MAGKVNWHGHELAKGLQAAARRNTAAACKRLQSHIKAEISQAGTLRYNPTTKRGRISKSFKTIYNFTHSAPGNPPYKQTGHLRRSIAWELVSIGVGSATVTGRVGTNLKYGRWLELGTKRIRRRPYIVITLRRHETEIRAILIGGIAGGGLVAIVAISNRSGVLGRGAIGAGY